MSEIRAAQATVDGAPVVVGEATVGDRPVRVGAATVNHPAASTPTGVAGGVLAGTYPNPQFAVPMATRDDVDSRLSAHTRDPAPHPSYDDIPDLTLWFDNALL